MKPAGTIILITSLIVGCSTGRLPKDQYFKVAKEYLRTTYPTVNIAEYQKPTIAWIDSRTIDDTNLPELCTISLQRAVYTPQDNPREIPLEIETIVVWLQKDGTPIRAQRLRSQPWMDGQP